MAAWDFCPAIQETLDHILLLESVKKLDLTLNDQSNFGSIHNGSVPSDMKTSTSLLLLSVGDSEKGSRVKTSSLLEA